MKARYLILPLVFLAACQQIETPAPSQKPSGSETAWTLTVPATKDAATTKALDLVNDGNTLNAYWKNTETVKVYKEGTLIGNLAVAPASGEKPLTATLSGTFDNVSGLAVGNSLTLIIPRESWNYTGQVGTLASIETNYDYAIASVTIATVDEVNRTITTNNANFANQQSIYRFGFKVGEDYVTPSDFTISTQNGKLVSVRTLSGSEWTSTLGSVNVVPTSNPSDFFYYVALRNESTAADKYYFQLHVSNSGALYTATKDIPDNVLNDPGKFISAKSISITQPSFAPIDGGTTTTAL